MSISQLCDACGRVIKLEDMITCSKCASQDDQLIRDLEGRIEELQNELKIAMSCEKLIGKKNYKQAPYIL